MNNEYKTIYELLWNSEEKMTEEFKNNVDIMISKLPENIKKYMELAYGNDLENPKRSESWTNEDTLIFYGKIIPSLKRRMDNPNGKFSSEFILRRTDKLELSYLYKIKANNFNEVKSLFTDKQVTIINMLLGFNDRYYNTKEIANYLNMSSVSVLNELRNICNICKEYFNNQALSSKTK